ncbi:MAG: hypothetical protein DRQ47_05605, partial [Gammaproteobacteria bacterium]
MIPETLDRYNFWKLMVFPVTISILLVIMASYNFLAFHLLAEFIPISIAYIIFAFAWFTYDFSKNTFLMILASGYFWIGNLDLIHALSYKGMDLFIFDQGNTSIQFWIMTRYAEALLLLVTPFLIDYKISKVPVFTIFGIIAISIILFTLSGMMPVAFVDGVGLTSFKIYSEYIIDAILFLAILNLLHHGNSISKEEKTLISWSIVLTMCAELAFTYYVSVYGISNLVGHIFKLFSFWMIFLAVVYSNLRTPFLNIINLKNYNRNLFETSTVGLALAKMDGTLVDA